MSKLSGGSGERLIWYDYCIAVCVLCIN